MGKSFLDTKPGAPQELIAKRLHSERLALDFVQAGKYLYLLGPACQEFPLISREQTRRIESAEAERARLHTELAALQNWEQMTRNRKTL